MAESALTARLRALADEKYRAFQSGLVPTLAPGRILGVRMPELRALARQLKGSPKAADFMSTLPHEFYDENNLHGLLINGLKDYGETLRELRRFLPFVDNWATCDLLSPKSFKKRPEGLLGEVEAWISSRETYTVRFGVGVLLGFYLDEGFEPRQLELAASACCDEYYVNMMAAWYFATALAKQREAALPWIEARRLPAWVHNKTIQKAIESRRISPEDKEYLRTLKLGRA